MANIRRGLAAKRKIKELLLKDSSDTILYEKEI
jgi:hypothetical protein